MLFNSIDFLLFFPFTLIVCMIVGNMLQGRVFKVFLLIMSFIFYMAWNVNFIFLLLASIFLDYFVALGLSKDGMSDAKRKIILVLSLIGNLGFLSYFKYTNFFLGVLSDVNFFNSYRFPVYNIILPVGISFYTFQSMSYTIDVYRKQIVARKSFVDFALYVSFFPQLVAGPIVRAHTFFRDLDNRLPVTLEDIKISFSRILLGFTKKVVFADNISVMVDLVFKNYESLNAFEIWIGAIGFAWQIYYDFSGYTDIAIGVARLFGFQFDKNFDFPYVVRNINEYWGKWHISFITWIRDYIYIPLGGSRGGKLATYRNIFITFLFGGIWHGAAYHFVLWGIWNALAISIHREYSNSKIHEKIHRIGGLPYNIFSRLLVVIFLGISAIFFRGENMDKGWVMLKTMFFLNENVSLKALSNGNYGALLILCFIASYIFSRYRLEKMVESGRAMFFFFLVNFFLLLTFAVTESQSFIYFAF